MIQKSAEGPIVITGGAGFIGTNLSDALLTQGEEVIIVDNLSRSGSRRNLDYLMNKHRKRLQILIADIRDKDVLQRVIKDTRMIYHFAAQVAVTESIRNPLNDFHINCEATLNILESIRSADKPPFLLFTSTNKVYGDLKNVTLNKNSTRYFPDTSSPICNGIGETWNLDFHSPYGCSKGSADQYVIDYSRIYGIPAAVFRMSCIYGPHQFGNEDQGWIAHFLTKIIRNEPITIYGDGLQVRDVLYIGDLVCALQIVKDNQSACSGHAFTIGGGSDQSVSILEFIDLLKDITGKNPQVDFSTWRPGDQKFYISDIQKFRSLFNWKPEVSVHDGISHLYTWLSENIAEKSPSSGDTQERNSNVTSRCTVFQ